MAVTVRHAKTNNVPDITQEQLDDGIARGIYAAGTTLEDIVLPSDWNEKQDFSGQADFAPSAVAQDAKPNTKALRLLLLLS